MDYQTQSYSDVMTFPIRYYLSRADKPQFTKYYHLINKTKKHKLINNALQWLNSYATERNHNKSIIYLAIVLESFFTNSGETDSLTHKLRCRVASLLALKFSDKKKIYDNINDFYKVRSKILHGKQTGIFNELNITDEYVRRSIRNILGIVAKFESQNFEKQYDEFLTRLDLSDLGSKHAQIQ